MRWIKKFFSIINGDRSTARLIEKAKEQYEFDVNIKPIMLQCCADAVVSSMIPTKAATKILNVFFRVWETKREYVDILLPTDKLMEYYEYPEGKNECTGMRQKGM